MTIDQANLDRETGQDEIAPSHRANRTQTRVLKIQHPTAPPGFSNKDQRMSEALEFARHRKRAPLFLLCAYPSIGPINHSGRTRHVSCPSASRISTSSSTVCRSRVLGTSSSHVADNSPRDFFRYSI